MAWDPFVYEGDGWQVERTGWEEVVYREPGVELIVAIRHFASGHGATEANHIFVKVPLLAPIAERDRALPRVVEACERLFGHSVSVQL